MPEDLGYSSDESDRYMTMSMAGEMAVDFLQLSSRDLKTFRFGIDGICSPGFEVGWVNSVAVRFYHDEMRIGQSIIEDIPIFCDDNNRLTIGTDEDHENLVKINNMVGFKSFFEDLLPKKGVDSGLSHTKAVTAALSVSRKGHRLTMEVDTTAVPRMSCSLTGFSISGDKSKIDLQLTNPSPFVLIFDGHCDFVLRKGPQTVGLLFGYFEIQRGTYTCSLEGSIGDGVSGMVTLKGSECDDVDNSWQQYVIRLFEVEINLSP